MAMTPEEMESLRGSLHQANIKLGLEKPDKELTELAGDIGEAGKGQEVVDVLGQVGEEPNKFLSGGAISDTFDVLNALQYGVTGVLKGKSFMEGVETRQSFSDKDAFGDDGIPGLIAGVALDIAVDPLTYIAPISALRKLGALKHGRKAVKGLANTKLGKLAIEKIGEPLGRKFIYMFGVDPSFRSAYERSTKNIHLGMNKVIELARPIFGYDGKTQKAITSWRKGGMKGTLPPDVLGPATHAMKEFDRLAKEMVELELLPRELVYGGSKIGKDGELIDFGGTLGEYLPTVFHKYEKAGGMAKWMKKYGDRLKNKKFTKGMDEETLESVGAIMEAGIPTLQGLTQMTYAVERVKFYNQIAEAGSVIGGKFKPLWVSDTAKEGWKKLPIADRLGRLSGKWMPENIAEYVRPMMEPMSDTAKWQKLLVKGFKFGKVIMNPATHARNIMSNIMLNNFEGLNPITHGKYYLKAFKEVSAKNKSKFYKEAKQLGLGLDTFHSSEISGLLKSQEFLEATGQAGLKGASARAAGKISDTLASLYQGEEEWAKMAMYMYQKDQGKSGKAALRIAERATFDYAQVTPFVKKLRESLFGLPFITFTAKATPQIGRTALRAPGRISWIGKVKEAIEEQVPSDELKMSRANEPDYIKNGFFIPLKKKDKHGRQVYFDLTYIIPFGDLISGQFFDADKTGESATRGILRKQPILNLIAELAENKDFFGQDIIKGDSTNTAEIGMDVMRHLVTTLGPAGPAGEVISEALGKPSATRKSFEFAQDVSKDPSIAQERGARTPGQEAMRQIGLKVTPFNTPQEQKKRLREIKLKLNTIAEGLGIRKKFTKSFKPKEIQKKRTIVDLFRGNDED